MTYKTYGTTLTGDHPTEAAEMATFFNQLPHRFKAVALHIRNEGKRNDRQMQHQKAQGGFIKGASDIIIPAKPAFVCEMKSLNKGSRASKEQLQYLDDAAAIGAFACLCYGWESAWAALHEWQTHVGA